MGKLKGQQKDSAAVKGFFSTEGHAAAHVDRPIKYTDLAHPDAEDPGRPMGLGKGLERGGGGGWGPGGTEASWSSFRFVSSL